VPIPPEPISVHAPALGRPRLLGQRWRDVTFLHWAVDPAAVQRFLPPGVRPDVFRGRTYVGLVAFRMVDVGVARGPALPAFLETNVRLYSVDGTGRRGVVFLSLDADQAAVVAAGRAVFGLPYRWARMRFQRSGPELTYTTRLRRPGVAVSSTVVVRAGEPEIDGPLERFLTARWGLHLRRLGRTWYLPNTHEPWPLRGAELVALDDEVLASVGWPELAGRAPDHVSFSRGVRASFGLPVPASRPRSS
jgi:uncharacterized protein